MGEPKAYLVESIPTGMEDLENTTGVKYTKDVLTELTGQATQSIDLTAMYWTLVPGTGSANTSGFTEEQLEALGASYGETLFKALEQAAERGVKLRIIQSPGFEGNAVESQTLKDKYPGQVEIREINMSDWFGGGIMHQKIWVFDGKDIYLGSANMDWKSLTQVKEIGVVLEDHPEVAADVTRYYQGWWEFVAMEPDTVEVNDPRFGFLRKVPAWSSLVPEPERRPSPLDTPDLKTPYNFKNPMETVLNGEKGGLFITGCPGEICAPDRSYDGDGLVQTILDARKSVCVSVMDWAPTSLYRGIYDNKTHKCYLDKEFKHPATAAWWPVLIDALLRAVITNGVQARLMIGKWAHTNPVIEPFLRGLRDTAAAGKLNNAMACGSLDIRLFQVPGWQDTEGTGRKYPGHSRVNHTKYIVTGERLNIGTSNMTWDYFFSTAGSSFNADHPGLVAKLQEIFDRDWNSKYVYPLS